MRVVNYSFLFKSASKGLTCYHDILCKSVIVNLSAEVVHILAEVVHLLKCMCPLFSIVMP